VQSQSFARRQEGCREKASATAAVRLHHAAAGWQRAPHLAGTGEGSVNLCNKHTPTQAGRAHNERSVEVLLQPCAARWVATPAGSSPGISCCCCGRSCWSCTCVVTAAGAAATMGLRCGRQAARSTTAAAADACCAWAVCVCPGWHAAAVVVPPSASHHRHEGTAEARSSTHGPPHHWWMGRPRASTHLAHGGSPAVWVTES
jgi:hypothetical protein